MDAARWNRVKALFERVYALPPEERAAMLAKNCRDDASLREEVESLLDSYDEAPDYLDRLADAVVPAVLHTHEPPPIDPLIGQTITHYEILRQLGVGGMGVVYEARDTRLDRSVALKFLPPHLSTDEDAKERFITEAQAASALDHPNVATIYGIGETSDGKLFIVMPCYEGETLASLIKRGPLPLSTALGYALQAANGLSAAHRKGIVHRDVKPANLMITSKGRIKILDFGLAKMTDVNLTQTGIRLGTVAYMSPEQISGEHVDYRTDLWSLGVVLHEALTGTPPFRGGVGQSLLYAIRHETPTPPSALRRDLPPALDQAVRKCLTKDPAGRYQTAAALRRDLTSIRRSLDAHRPAALPERTGRLSSAFSPYAQRIAGGLGGVLLVVSLLLWLLPMKSRTEAPELPVEKQLAVLPFTGTGSNPTERPFADGLVEMITGKLARLESFQDAFWVVPAGEVRARAPMDAPAARRAFGVNLVVMGNLRRDTGLVRLTLRLVDPETSRPLGATTLVEPTTEITALQDSAIFALARMLELKLPPRARRLLTSGRTIVPSAYEFYLQGRGYLQRYETMENVDHALRLFEQALALDTAYALAHAGLCEAYWRKYEASQEPRMVAYAVQHCESAAALNDRLPPVPEALGLVYMGTGRYEEAIRQFQDALSLDPASADAHRGLARAYEAQGRLDAAEAAYKEAIRLKPGYWSGYNALGVFYFLHGRYEEAIAQFRQVVALTPDNVRGYNNLGALHFSMEDYAAARTAFEHALAIEPTYDSYSNLGTVYFYEAQYLDAARMYRKALQLDDRDYLVWGNLASAYYWAPGQRHKAESAYRQAVLRAEEQRQVNPLDPGLLCDLANYYAMLGRRDEALLHLRQALALAPDNVEVMFSAGDTYEQLGERDQALTWIAEALEHGYSQVKVERSPGLRQLRTDERFEQLMNRLAPSLTENPYIRR